MPKRALFFTSPCSLSIKNGQLIIERANGETSKAPIEDLGYIIIDNPMVRITIPTINSLAEENCTVIYCNSSHMPSAMLMYLDTNHVQGETYRYQIEAKSSLKNNLWKQIVTAKIKNQADLLNELNLDGDCLKPFYMNVKSGDSNNREGHAARLYWSHLFKNDFVRDRDGNYPNNLLNFGYSILRSTAAKALMGSGLFPAFGLYHKNRYNSFPLADDIMEPYRPFVDQIVYQLVKEGKQEMDIGAKQALIKVLYVDTHFEKCTRPLETGMVMTTASLAKCLKGEANTLSLPSIQ